MCLLYRTYTPFLGVEPLVSTQTLVTFGLLGEVNASCSLNIVRRGYNHKLSIDVIRNALINEITCINKLTMLKYLPIHCMLQTNMQHVPPHSHVPSHSHDPISLLDSPRALEGGVSTPLGSVGPILPIDGGSDGPTWYVP